MLKQETGGNKGIEYYMQLPYSVLLHQVEDDGEKCWIAEIPELPGCKSHGSTVEEAVNSVEEAKKDWILDSLEEGDEVPEPADRERFSGKTLVRMSRSLHRALSLLAESEQVSLNQLIVTVLAKEVGRLGTLNRVETKLDSVLTWIGGVGEVDERTPMLLMKGLVVDSSTLFDAGIQSGVMTDDSPIGMDEGAAIFLNAFTEPYMSAAVGKNLSTLLGQGNRIFCVRNVEQDRDWGLTTCSIERLAEDAVKSRP